MDIQHEARLILRAIKIAHHAVKSRFMRDWVPQRLTVTQFQALQHLRWYSGHQGMSIGELAEHLGLAYSTVSNLIDRLEHHGWVQRQQDPSDRRRVHILLTDQTRRLFEENRAQTDRFWQETIGRLATEERAALLGSLNRLIEVMESPQWPESKHHVPPPDSERQRFRQAMEAWIEAKTIMIGKASVLASLAEQRHDYELAGYLKQMAHDLTEQARDLWAYVEDPPNLKRLLEELKLQHSASRDAALEAWRYADAPEDSRFGQLLGRARQDVRKHIGWIHEAIARLT